MSGQEDRPNLPLVPASEGDRERARDLVKAACLDGQLTLDELASRVEQIESALTRDQVVEATRDLRVAPAGATVPRARTVSVLSDVQRVGRWRIGEATQAIVFMGACKLDLTSAVISEPVTTIKARVVMGSLDVIVPEGVEVDLDTTTVMGARGIKGVGSPPPTGRPLIRITGFAVMGAVTVRYSGPDRTRRRRP